MHPWRATYLLLALCAVSMPSLASRWVEVGNSGVTTDKVMVDTDSIRKVDDYRVVDIMTVYAAPRTNPNNITLDRHVQKTAIDCAARTFIGLITIGYVGEKRVGNSPETQDWRAKMKPLKGDGMTNRIYALVCNAALGGAPGDGSKPPGPKARSGSGIVVNDSGVILTNNHVVDRCKSITVKTPDSKPIPANVDGVDAKNDLALLKTLYGTPVGEPARFRSQARPAKLGESVGVVGYPLTGFLSAEPKATFGQVNSVAGANNDYTLLQISAPIQPGNSGGPVLDGSGLVIGVVSSTASMAVAVMAGNVPQNVNFAIRGEVAQIFLQARGVKLLTGEQHHALPTEDVAATGEKSTVFILCSME